MTTPPPGKYKSYFMELSRLSCDAEGFADTLFVISRLEGDILTLKASDGKNSWQGSLCREKMKELAEESKMSVGDYLQETMMALAGHQIRRDLLFVYSNECLNSGMLSLTWKKQLADGVRFKLGSMDLKPCDSKETNLLLLNQYADDRQELLQKVEILSKKCDRLDLERENALEDFKKCSSRKDEMESDLYGKFRLILNEKKSKIRKLMEIKGHLTGQNEETLISESVPPPTEVEETNSKKATSSATKPETSVISLLNDASSCKPLSPPPIKKQHLAAVPEKHKALIPRPPLLSSSTAKDTCSSEKVDYDASVDASELLEMI